MPATNIERLIKLAEDTFAYRQDPAQLNVDESVVQHLQMIHSACMSEYSEPGGPVAWVLVLPTTLDLMNRFVEGKITERELYELTPVGGRYEAIYLCSALVLEEYRRKGIAKRLALEAIKEIRKEYPIKSLFAWPFTREGDLAAEAIAQSSGLPLVKKV